MQEKRKQLPKKLCISSDNQTLTDDLTEKMEVESLNIANEVQESISKLENLLTEE